MLPSVFSTFTLCSALTLCILQASPLMAKAKEQKAPTLASGAKEAFLVRRIAEFWKDGDYTIVKNQILDFFNTYPESSSKDYFLGILGDIYLHDTEYNSALTSYDKIQDKHVIEKIIVNKLQCYYELNLYKELEQEAKTYFYSNANEIKERKDELNFLLGEALFRQALQENEKVQQKKLATEAKTHYDALKGLAYQDISEFAIAEIYSILEENEKAATQYLKLAEKYTDKQEDLFFQAATHQSQYNRSDAIATFKKIQSLGGNRIKEASFNQFVLLFQNEEYREVIENYKKIASDIPPSYEGTYHFIVGKSFFSIGDYQNAITPLEKYIARESNQTESLKNAILIQMICAERTKDADLFSHSFEKLETLFPNDKEIPQAIFIHAMLLKEKGALDKADEKLLLIKNKYQSFATQENFSFEYALLAHQTEKWGESYHGFKSYVTQFPESDRIATAWKLFLSSSLNYYKTGGEESGYNRKLFFQDLQKVLKHKNHLTQDEMKNYALLYAKTSYELNNYTEGLRILQDHIFSQLSEESDPLTLAEGHFIAGLCHREIAHDYSAFCMHLEQALYLNPEQYDSPATHLQLFNAYISLAGLAPKSQASPNRGEQQDFIDEAATHLTKAIMEGGQSVQLENRLWLANYYYQQVNQYIDAHGNKKLNDHTDLQNAITMATRLYENIFFQEGKSVPFSPETLYMEQELLKLGKLLEYQNQNEKKLFVLQSLVEQQSQGIALKWAFQKQALFELALTYKSLGKNEKAFETFSFINEAPEKFQTTLANEATLESAKLHFSLLDAMGRTESNQEVLSILNDLKELQIRKNANSEPTHLEAALEYVEIRSVLAKAEEKEDRHLFFLNRMLEDFTSESDPLTQDYLHKVNQNGRKKQLFASYMKYVKGEKLRLEAKKMYKQERFLDMEELHENALSCYNEIKNDYATPHTLYQRVERSIEEINRLSSYSPQSE